MDTVVEIPEIIAPSVSPKPIPTLTQEIHRLSVKHGVSEELVKRIIKCESSLYKNAVNENIRDGKVWSRDYGPLQINDFYHKKDMAKIGLNITAWGDSLTYGFMLLKRDGTRHWNASKHCWNS